MHDKPHEPTQAERECFFCEPLPCIKGCMSSTPKKPARPDIEAIQQRFWNGGNDWLEHAEHDFALLLNYIGVLENK